MAIQSKEEFARLLSEGIYRIKIQHSKSIQIVQDELGYALGRQGGTAIEHWRRGNIPANLADLENLAKELVVQGQLNQSWLKLFLLHGGHPNPTQVVGDVFLANDSQALPPSSVNLPGKNYRELVGRQTLLAQIREALEDKNGRWLITIDGQGGIGKTALARNIAEQCQLSCHFTAVVWISASRNDLPGAMVPEGGLTFHTCLDAIAAQLNQPDIAKLPPEQKSKRLQALLRSQPVLIILDNLETAVTPQNEIVTQLRPFLNPSKALFTSRQRFRGDLFAIHLDGLVENEAVQFIQQDATEKGISHVAEAMPQQLFPVITATGGSPLALKLIVSQLAHFDLPIVLQHLTEVNIQNSTQNEYINFYKHVYGRSWSLLSETNQQLLITLAHFAPGVGGNFKAIKQVSQLPHANLVESIDKLWQFSFLEIGAIASLQENIRYYLHPLTQHFVLSDVIQLL